MLFSIERVIHTHTPSRPPKIMTLEERLAQLQSEDKFMTHRQDHRN